MVGFALVAVTALFALASPRADAQVVPFKVTGGGSAPDGLPVFPGGTAPHNATGTGTQIGKYTGNGVFELLSLDPDTGSGTFQGSFVFVAANGDRLAFSYGDTDNGADQPGQFQIYPAGDGKVVVVFVAEFNPIPSQCTGRFRNVIDGSFVMTATTEPFALEVNDEGYTTPFNYTWSGSGWIETKKGK
jgi:hypothetical protein